MAEGSVSLSFFSTGVEKMREYSRQYSNEYQSNVICVKPQCMNCYLYQFESSKICIKQYCLEALLICM